MNNETDVEGIRYSQSCDVLVGVRLFVVRVVLAVVEDVVRLLLAVLLELGLGDDDVAALVQLLLADAHCRERVLQKTQLLLLTVQRVAEITWQQRVTSVNAPLQNVGSPVKGFSIRVGQF